MVSYALATMATENPAQALADYAVIAAYHIRNGARTGRDVLTKLLADHPYDADLIKENLAQIVGNARQHIPENAYQFNSGGEIIEPDRITDDEQAETPKVSVALNETPISTAARQRPEVSTGTVKPNAGISAQDLEDLTYVVAGRLAKGAKGFAEVAAHIKEEFPAHYEAFVRNGQEIYTNAKNIHRDRMDSRVRAPKATNETNETNETKVQANPSEMPKPVDEGIANPKVSTGPVQPDAGVTAESIGVRSALNPTMAAGASSPIPKEAPVSLQVNNQRPKAPEVNTPSFEHITQETKEVPTLVEIPATNRGMLKFRALGFLFLILAAFGAVVFVPSGDPTTYGRQVSPSYEFVWLIGSGRVVDMGRVWTQTFILVAAAAACFYFSEKDKQS
jgi:hypothetical protein